jgi:hypothetical protein
MATLPALLARLDADERVRGRQWERICAWFLTHDPAYLALLRHVWLWREWPGRWGVDAGIDLGGWWQSAQRGGGGGGRAVVGSVGRCARNSRTVRSRLSTNGWTLPL